LFLRVHGYTLPLVLLLYSSITLFLKAPTEEVKIWILITFLDFFVTASLLTYGGNLLGSERNFWIVRILSKSPTITSIYERLTALIFLKVLVGPFYTFLYCVVKKNRISDLILLLNIHIKLWCLSMDIGFEFHNKPCALQILFFWNRFPINNYSYDNCAGYLLYRTNIDAL
jgi:hypothetical protein